MKSIIAKGQKTATWPGRRELRWKREKSILLFPNLAVLLDTEEDFVYSIESKSGNLSERTEEFLNTERKAGSFL